MKNLKFFLGLPFFMLMSCSDADDIVQKINITANGNWSLVKVSGTIAGVNNTFPEGVITWKFDEVNRTITIINNNPNNALEDIFNSGVYNYAITNNAINAICTENIEINATDFGCFSEIENKIIITQSVADGFDLLLIKQ